MQSVRQSAGGFQYSECSCLFSPSHSTSHLLKWNFSAPDCTMHDGDRLYTAEYEVTGHSPKSLVVPDFAFSNASPRPTGTAVLVLLRGHDIPAELDLFCDYQFEGRHGAAGDADRGAAAPLGTARRVGGGTR